MKYILLAFTLMLSQSFAEVSMRPPEEVTKPTHPIVRPEKPRRHKEKYLLLHQDNHYYTNVVSTCDRYIKIIEKKDEEIKLLKQEIKGLRKKEQIKMQKSLKEAYNKEMKKFENRQSSVHTKSKAVISDTPID